MQKRTRKRIVLTLLSVVTLLVMILCVHIYIVTRPKPMDPHAMAMARIDLKQPITQDDASRISTWLYQQKGIDHVLVNPQTDIAVFTFFPAKTTADQIVSNFKADLPYKAERYLPSEAEMRTGCPAMSGSGSISYKVYSFFKNIF